MLGAKHILTGHNADDIAETVLMNSKYLIIQFIIIFKYTLIVIYI